MKIALTIEIPSIVVTALGITQDKVEGSVRTGLGYMIALYYRKAYGIEGRASAGDNERMRELTNLVRVQVQP